MMEMQEIWHNHTLAADRKQPCPLKSSIQLKNDYPKWKKSPSKIFHDTISIGKAISTFGLFGLMHVWLNAKQSTQTCSIKAGITSSMDGL